jgi:hypothetical protein
MTLARWGHAAPRPTCWSSSSSARTVNPENGPRANRLGRPSRDVFMASRAERVFSMFGIQSLQQRSHWTQSGWLAPADRGYSARRGFNSHRMSERLVMEDSGGLAWSPDMARHMHGTWKLHNTYRAIAAALASQHNSGSKCEPVTAEFPSPPPPSDADP